MKTIYAFFTVLVFITISADCLLAQGPGGPPATPIDGGLSLLLAAGGVYGLKKLIGSKRS